MAQGFAWDVRGSKIRSPVQHGNCYEILPGPGLWVLGCSGEFIVKIEISSVAESPPTCWPRLVPDVPPMMEIRL